MAASLDFTALLPSCTCCSSKTTPTSPPTSPSIFEAHGDIVEHALDGESGLQLALDRSYDAIVLDLMLPGLDGLSLCRQLRQAGRTRVPVLMLTAKDLLADKIEGFEAGADDYLVKPFSLAELDARLKALVRRASVTEAPRVLSVGDLRFDLDTLEAERGGERVKLNPTTRRLLIVLLQNSHRVVTAPELERELWGDQPPQGDFLRAHMHALRTAIDKNFPASCCTRSMAPVIDFRRNRYVRKLRDWFAQLSLRARIAGTMIALVASAGLVLSAWAYLADERLKRNITLRPAVRGADALRTTHARRSRRRTAALGAPEHLSIQRPVRAAATHRDAQAGRDAPRALARPPARRAGARRRLRPPLHHLRRHDLRHARKTIALLVLALGVGAIVISPALAAAAISRRLVEPVTALADRLTQIDPGQRHVRIGAQFAGNELEPIARSIDTFMERLDGFVEREQSFTATASHELRTPLAVMRGAVELLETQAASRPGANKALARIQRAVREMTEFTDALLALSREQLASPAADATCDVNAVLARIVEDQRSVAPDKRIVLDIEAAEPAGRRSGEHGRHDDRQPGAQCRPARHRARRASADRTAAN